MIDDREARDFAIELRTAELDGSSVDLPSKRYPRLDWSGARRIARERDALRRADGDEHEVTRGATGFATRTLLRWLERGEGLRRRRA